MFFYHSAQKECKHEMFSEKINDNSSYSIPGITKTQCFIDSRASFNESSSPGSRKDDLKSSYYPKLSTADNGSVISGVQSMVMQPQMQQQSYSSEGYNIIDIASQGMQRIDQESIKRNYSSKTSVMNTTNNSASKNGNMYLMSSVPPPSTLSQSNYNHNNISKQGKATVHDQKPDSSYITNQEYYSGYSKSSGNELQRVVSDMSGEKKEYLKNDHVTGYPKTNNNDERNDFYARGRVEDASRCDATTPSYANNDSDLSTNKVTSTPPRSGLEARLDYNDDNAAARMLRFLQVHSPSQNSIAELYDDPVSIIEDDESKNHQRRSTSLLTESSESSSSSSYELKEQPVLVTKSHKEIKKSTTMSGKMLENSDESKKALKPPAQKNNEPILPDLRHVLPPWQKLVGHGSKVVELEDRDELFIPDEEKQDVEGNNNSAILSQDRSDAIRLRSRSTIDPSFDALFVAMAQMVPCRLNADDQNSAITSYKNHEIGFPGLSCRHCGGRPGSGRYFPNSVRSLSQTTTAHNMIKHFVNASNVVPDDEYYRDGDVGQDDEGCENEERENNDAEDRSGSQKKMGGKAQRIGGRHCTKCPYSVWLWLNEFQRRLKECKSVEGSNEVDYPPQDNGQRVKYGARKIFYNRVWQRMNTQNDATLNDDERDDIDDRGEIENGDHSINTHSRTSLNPGDKNHPMIAVAKKKKQSLKSKGGNNTKVIATDDNYTATKSSENHANDRRTKKRKNEITFLDLTFGANVANSGDNDLQHKQQKQRRL